MEQNHDTVKQQASERIRKSGRIALIITVLILIGQIFSYAAKIIYTAKQPDTLQDMTMIGYLTFRPYGTIPDLIVRCILTFGTMALLLLLFGSLRKTGLPFTERNVRLMKAAGILQGLQAVLPAVFHVVQLIFYDGISVVSHFREFFRSVNHVTFGVCAVLFFLAWTFRYGIVLQTESDETL